MGCLRVVALLALLCAVANATEEEAKIDGVHHGHNNPNFPLQDDVNNDLGEKYHVANNPNLPGNVVEGRKFFKPYFYHPFHHPHRPHHPAQNPDGEVTEFENPDVEEVTANPESESLSNVDETTLAAQPYDESDLVQEDIISEEVVDTEVLEEFDGSVYSEDELEGSADEPSVQPRMQSKASVAVDCDFLTAPRFSCYSCYTYLECKPKGGKVKSCSDPYKPFCVDGLCSFTPSDVCSLSATKLYENVLE